MADRRFPEKAAGEIAEGTSPAEFPIGSIESRVAARALLEARRPLETVVELDDEFNPIFDPSKQYAKVVIFVPRSMSRDEWLREQTHLEDVEKLHRQRQNWFKWNRPRSLESLSD